MTVGDVLSERLDVVEAIFDMSAEDGPPLRAAFAQMLRQEIDDATAERIREVLSAIPPGDEARAARALTTFVRIMFSALDAMWDALGDEIALRFFARVLGTVSDVAHQPSVVPAPSSPEAAVILETRNSTPLRDWQLFVGVWTGVDSVCTRVGILREIQAHILAEVACAERKPADLDLLRPGGNFEVTNRQWAEVLEKAVEPEKFRPLIVLLGGSIGDAYGSNA